MSGLKFRDLSESSEEHYGAIPSTTDKTDYFPEIRINLDKLPELDGADIGDMVEISFDAEIVSITKSENENCVRLSLQSGAVVSISKPKAEAKKSPQMPKNETDQVLDAQVSYNPRYD